MRHGKEAWQRGMADGRLGAMRSVRCQQKGAGPAKARPETVDYHR
jgi:hypothetical protein